MIVVAIDSSLCDSSSIPSVVYRGHWWHHKGNLAKIASLNQNKLFPCRWECVSPWMRGVKKSKDDF